VIKVLFLWRGEINCDVFCPYAETKDKDNECEAWRIIQRIDGRAENDT